MLKKKIIAFCALALWSLISCYGASQDETVIFNAKKDGIKAFKNSTCTWHDKNSDYNPVVSVSEDGDSLNFTYTGTKGRARSRLINAEKQVRELVRSGKSIVGFKAIIGYDNGDGKIYFCFRNGLGRPGICSFTPQLDRGKHEYVYEGRKGWDWNSLKSLDLDAIPGKGNAKNFKLYQLSFLTKDIEKREKARELKIDFVRPTQEIFQAQSPLTDKAVFNSDYNWQTLSKLELNSSDKSACTANVNIGFDDKNLFLRAEAEYPEKPLAKIAQNDKNVWEDEAFELFFSGRHNNDRADQFAINSNGIIFDRRRAFDATAAKVINDVQWNLPHQKKYVFMNGMMAYELALPLNELGIDRKSRPFIGFNAVFDYAAPVGKAPTFLKWSHHPEIKWNYKPQTFGFLVLNQQKFGTGSIQAEKILRLELDKQDECDLYVKTTLSDFLPGDYTATQWLIQPDFSTVEKSVPLNISQDGSVFFTMDKAKNLNGLYTWILGIKNKAGDTKLLAVDFKNKVELIDLVGTDLVWPRPKELRWAKSGVFNVGEKHILSVSSDASDRTLTTVKMFQEKLLGYAGSEYRVVKGSERDIVLKISSDVVFDGRTEELKPEGYHIKITPEKVEITGADESGLFYGTVTFIQMLKSPMKRLDNAPVKCGEVLDWPDLKNRLFSLFFYPGAGADPWNGKVVESFTLDWLCSYIDRFVVGSKSNRMPLKCEMSIIFERSPKVNWGLETGKRPLSLSDLRKLNEFCRERFIELIPLLTLGGHGEWLTSPLPELREKGWLAQQNVAHPDFWPIYRDCMQDLVEATDCKYFFVGGDEWWHDYKSLLNRLKAGYRDYHGIVKETVPLDDLINGKTRAQAMLDIYLKVHQFLKERNIRMLIFEDMMNPWLNGKRYDVYKIIDKLPKDIIFCCWSWFGGEKKVSTYFHEKGFELWGNCTSWHVLKDKDVKDMHTGFGSSLYAMWGILNEPYGMLSQLLRSTDYAWNFYQGNERSYTDEINSGVMPALHAMLSLNPNPYASQIVKPINLSSTLNNSLASCVKKKWPTEYKNDVPIKLPEGVVNLANIPTQLGTSEKNCVVVGDGEKASFNVTGKFSSLIFLHSTYGKVEKFVKNWEGLWRMGWPVGSYIIKYDDGTMEKYTANYKMNIFKLRSRPVNGWTVLNRYIYAPKTARGDNLFLYQAEWVNPHPDKKIVNVTFKDDKRIPAETMIFAISGREVKQPSVGSE